jgi:hypothetical protein
MHMSPARRTSTVAHKLSLMTFNRFSSYCTAVALMLMGACRDTPSARNADSTASKAIAPPLTGTASETGWDSTAGQILIVAASKAPADAVIVLPGLTDSTLVATPRFELRNLVNVPVDLFNSTGLVGTSVLQVTSQSSDPSGCVRWPTGMLSGSVSPGWKVALEKGKATGIPLDSMEGLSGPDSAQFVADVLKVARSLTDGSDPVFRGIPFFVRKGYRLMTLGSSVVIGDAVRKINEEANPREEHLFLLAERSGNDTTYHIGFHTRSAGPEESLETSEILSALRLKRSGRTAIVITFDYEDGGKVGLLERLGANNWQVVWKSAYTDC